MRSTEVHSSSRVQTTNNLFHELSVLYYTLMVAPPPIGELRHEVSPVGLAPVATVEQYGTLSDSVLV